MLNWVTRGVFLGYQRNYLELQVDDLFLGDDAWDPATQRTNYDPARGEPDDADRRRPGDRLVASPRAAARHGLQRRRQRALQGQADRATDPLRGQVRRSRRQRGLRLRSTTPTSTRTSTARRRRSSPARSPTTGLGSARGLPVDAPSELVTGEHSGLANTRPGNPGTIDPPSFDDIDAAAGGAIAGGDLRLRADRAARQPARRPPRSRPTSPSPAGGKVTATFDAVCHAVAYTLYRRAGRRRRVDAVVARRAAHANAPTDDGTDPDQLDLTDTGAPARTAGPAGGQRRGARRPTAQNPNFPAGVDGGGDHVRSPRDASKGYPSNPTVLTSPLLPPGASF